MPKVPDSSPPRAIPTRALGVFLVTTFAITWGLLGVYIAFPTAAADQLGELSGTHPVFFIATWAPALAALMVVFGYRGGRGIRLFLSRLLLWRCPPAWATFILLGLPGVFIVGSLLKGGPLLAPLPFGSGVMILFLMLLLGPVEELGWRGVMQPLLQRHLAPIWAGALLGAVWGLWHLPAFFLAGTVFGEWSFLPFFIGNVMLGVLITPLFNASGGSLLQPMLFHWQLINPFWPDAQPWDSVLLSFLALSVVWWHRGTMFSREGAVTELLPAAASASGSKGTGR